MAIDKKQSVLLVLLTLSSAFVTLDHQHFTTLLQELIGMDGTALKWSTSNLSNRTQWDTINGIKSAIHYLLFGVHQRSLGQCYSASISYTLAKSFENIILVFTFMLMTCKCMLVLSQMMHGAQKLETCIKAIHDWMTIQT